MTRVEHIIRCQAVLGKPWAEVHDFLDGYFRVMPYDAHRVLLHHALGIELCVRKLGEDARPAAELHVRDDFGGIVPAGPQKVMNAVLVFDEDVEIINITLASWGLPTVELTARGDEGAGHGA